MTEQQSCLAVIPARGGSKRLPGKNTMPLQGIPLLVWSIRCALACPDISRTVVSTDDEAMQKLALQHGAEAPFLRPAELSTDQASTAEVIQHALDHYRAQGIEFKTVMVLQPTSPLRQASDLNSAFAILRERQSKAVISVCPCEHHPYWCGTLPADGSLDQFLKAQVRGLRSQDLPPMYRLNGAIYLRDVEDFRKEKSLFPTENSHALIMPNERSVDIDSLLDFQLAQVLMSKADHP